MSGFGARAAYYRQAAHHNAAYQEYTKPTVINNQLNMQEYRRQQMAHAKHTGKAEQEKIKGDLARQAASACAGTALAAR